MQSQVWTFFYVSVLLTACFLCDLFLFLCCIASFLSYCSISSKAEWFLFCSSLYSRISTEADKICSIQFPFSSRRDGASWCQSHLTVGLRVAQHLPAWLCSALVTVVPMFLLWQGENKFHCPLLSLKRKRRGQNDRMPFPIFSAWFPGLSSWPLPSVSYHPYVFPSTAVSCRHFEPWVSSRFVFFYKS